MVIIHVFLLLINLLYHCQTVKIRQLFSYCLPDFLCGRFAATHERKIIFICSFSVGARFVFSGSMKPVNQLLGTFPRLIQAVYSVDII